MTAIFRNIPHIKYRKMWASVLLGYVSSRFISSNLKDHCDFIYTGKQCNNYMPSDRATHPRRTESSAALM
jgi:hypothetical protein